MSMPNSVKKRKQQQQLMQNRVATALERGDGRGEFGSGESRREKGRKRRGWGWIGRVEEKKASGPP